LEHDYARSPALGYEPPQQASFIRCLDHGFPTPFARWHYHEEYELHLIVATRAKRSSATGSGSSSRATSC